MLMDPKIWGDPSTFRPERFLSSEAESLPDPLVVICGFGMRYVVLTARSRVCLITVGQGVPREVSCGSNCIPHHHKNIGGIRHRPASRQGPSKARVSGVHRHCVQASLPLSDYIKAFLISLVECLSGLNATLFLGTLAL